MQLSQKCIRYRDFTLFDVIQTNAVYTCACMDAYVHLWLSSTISCTQMHYHHHHFMYSDILITVLIYLFISKQASKQYLPSPSLPFTSSPLAVFPSVSLPPYLSLSISSSFLYLSSSPVPSLVYLSYVLELNRK